MIEEIAGTVRTMSKSAEEWAREALMAQQDARAEGRREGIEAACRLVEHELGCDCSQTFRGDQHYASCRSAGTARLLVAIRALLSHEPLNCSRAPPPETK